MTECILLHEAEVELWEAEALYEDKAKGLGLDFAREVEQSIQSITQTPDRWPLRPDGTRRYLTQRFPYLVVYTHQNSRLWIIAIAHCKRQPAYCKHR